MEYQLYGSGCAGRFEGEGIFGDESEVEGDGAGGYAVVKRGSQSSSLFEMIAYQH